jgi:hypothetical protein
MRVTASMTADMITARALLIFGRSFQVLLLLVEASIDQLFKFQVLACIAGLVCIAFRTHNTTARILWF